MHKHLKFTFIAGTLGMNLFTVDIAQAAKPLPKATPTPKATAKPASKITPTATPVPVVNFKFKSAVIMQNGDIKPVPRNEFTVAPFTMASVEQELIKRNNPGPKPPEALEKPERTPEIQQFITYLGIVSKRYPNDKNKLVETLFDRFGSKTSDLWDQAAIQLKKELEQNTARLAFLHWELKAYEGKKALIEEWSKTQKVYTFKTDLDGEAKLSLETGQWYVNGSYEISSSNSQIKWIDVPLSVVVGLEKFELSNDNGTVTNKPD
jgi:hypothetical protein